MAELVLAPGKAILKSSPFQILIEFFYDPGANSNIDRRGMGQERQTAIAYKVDTGKVAKRVGRLRKASALVQKRPLCAITAAFFR